MLEHFLAGRDLSVLGGKEEKAALGKDEQSVPPRACWLEGGGFRSQNLEGGSMWKERVGD